MTAQNYLRDAEDEEYPREQDIETWSRTRFAATANTAYIYITVPHKFRLHRELNEGP